MNKKVEPFVKWAGGKRQLLSQLRERLPSKYKNYIEPFVGGGAVLFDLQPKRAIINDINKELIHTYKTIKKTPEEFIKKTSEFDKKIIDGGKEYYYLVRERYNDKIMKAEYDIEVAAIFVFLNKHCFNGLYRVNGKGLFNVPYNNSIRGSFNNEKIIATAKYLKTVEIFNGDFELACQDAEKGDFVFFDSPYAPLNPASFESYTKEGFDRESHIRLSRLFEELSRKGCYCMLTNHNTDFIKDLYYDYNQEIIDVRRSINSDAKNRVGKEIIIRNY